MHLYSTNGSGGQGCVASVYLLDSENIPQHVFRKFESDWVIFGLRFMQDERLVVRSYSSVLVLNAIEIFDCTRCGTLKHRNPYFILRERQ